MKIGILTSSRADFGIYYPLIKELWRDKSFNVELIVFGTHLKKEYGFTIREIENFGFSVKHRIDTLIFNNSPADISNSIGDTIIKFSKFWNEQSFDLVIALGDRYEMFGAVSAASPFNIDIAHIHAGETTLGAIDNAYRHSISLMSKYLFVSTDTYKKRAQEIINDSKNVFNVGALSIDNLCNQQFYSIQEFNEKFDIDLTKPTILTTFHPETISLDKNELYINELIKALKILKAKYQIVITMPNSDTLGNMIREKIEIFGKVNPGVKIIESFGMQGYLTCMKYCSMLLGNTSSGFVEAAFFPKWVINIGNRQKGRIETKNIINSKINTDDILKAVEMVQQTELSSLINTYGDGRAAKNILSKIKLLYGLK